METLLSPCAAQLAYAGRLHHHLPVAHSFLYGRGHSCELEADTDRRGGRGDRMISFTRFFSQSRHFLKFLKERQGKAEEGQACTERKGKKGGWGACALERRGHILKEKLVRGRGRARLNNMWRGGGNNTHKNTHGGIDIW